MRLSTVGIAVGEGNTVGVSEGEAVSVKISVGVTAAVSVGEWGVNVGKDGGLVGSAVSIGVGADVELQAKELNTNRIDRKNLYRIIQNHTPF